MLGIRWFLNLSGLTLGRAAVLNRPQRVDTTKEPDWSAPEGSFFIYPPAVRLWEAHTKPEPYSSMIVALVERSVAFIGFVSGGSYGYQPEVLAGEANVSMPFSARLSPGTRAKR